MSPTRQGPAGSGGQADELAGTLNRMAAAIDQARAAGLSVDVPDVLYRACLEVIARHDGSSDPDDPSARSRRRPAVESALAHSRKSATTGPLLSDVPLRRLVWQVLDPGQEFTVGEVTARLAELGVPVHPDKVSNALGYWVSRDRLARKSKGLYHYPIITPPSVASSNTRLQQDDPAGLSATPRRKDEDRDHAKSTQRRAM